MTTRSWKAPGPTPAGGLVSLRLMKGVVAAVTLAEAIPALTRTGNTTAADFTKENGNPMNFPPEPLKGKDKFFAYFSITLVVMLMIIAGYR